MSGCVVGSDCRDGWAVLGHIQELLARLISAELTIAPGEMPRRYKALRGLDIARGRRKGAEFGLFVLPAASGLNAIYSVPKWRSRFSVLAAYVIDSWYVDWFGPEARLFDYLFVSRAEDVGPVRDRTGRPTYHLPVGADVLAAAPWVASQERTNDLLVYGRQPPNYNYDVVEAAARRAGLSVQLRVPADPNPSRNQSNLFAALSRSKFALAFCNTISYHFDLPGVGSFLTIRWLEMLAGGAIVAGVLPRPKGYEAIVGWEGAYLDLPTDASAGMAIIAEKVQVYNPLAGIKNHYESLVRNDWRFRLRDLFTVVGLEIPPTLKAELAKLEEYRASLLSLYPSMMSVKYA